jgi:hypothetical protein
MNKTKLCWNAPTVTEVEGAEARTILDAMNDAPRDEFKDAVSDIVAVLARLILLAPREQQEMLCSHVLHEVGDTVEHIVGDGMAH